MRFATNWTEILGIKRIRRRSQRILAAFSRQLCIHLIYNPNSLLNLTTKYIFQKWSTGRCFAFVCGSLLFILCTRAKVGRIYSSVPRLCVKCMFTTACVRTGAWFYE